MGESDIKKTLDEGIEFMKSKRYSEAERNFRTIVNLCNQTKEHHSHPDSVYQMETSVLEHLGNSLYGQQRLAESFLMYKSGLSIYEKELPNNDEGIARCVHGLAEIMEYIGYDKGAKEYSTSRKVL